MAPNRLTMFPHNKSAVKNEGFTLSKSGGW